MSTYVRKNFVKQIFIAVFVIVVVVLFVALAGCAGAYRPLIDTKGVDMAHYETDLSECRQYAQQVAGPGTGAIAGATVGYGLGYLIARAMGSNDPAAAGRGAAVTAAAGGAGAGAQNELNVIRECMRGRGYKTLN